MGHEYHPILYGVYLLHERRPFMVVYPVGQDTGNYICTASIEVLNQILCDSVTFCVIVQSKWSILVK